MEQQCTNSWSMVNESLNFGSERWVASAENLIHRINQYLGITPAEEKKEISDRENRRDDILMLCIFDREIPPASMDFYERNEATKRLVQAGVISRKSRGGWKINRKVDPRKLSK